MQLFRTKCYTDCKGRPDHKLTFISANNSRNSLIQAMADDIVKWQAKELVELQKEWDEESGADDEEYLELGERPARWHKKDVRWEMLDNDMRIFVEKIEDDFCVMTYHILD